MNHNSPSKARYYGFALVAFLMISAGGRAATTFDLNFSTDQYTGNFTALANPSNLSYSTTASALVYSVANSGSVIDYTPGGSTTATFLSETISVTAAASDLSNGPSVGILSRLTGTTTTSTGILALANFNVTGTTQSARLRLFYGADNSAGIGTNFYDYSLNLTGNTVATSSPLTFTLQQSFNGTNSIFNLTVSDAEGLVDTTGNITLTATHLYDTAGDIGLRFHGAGLTQWTVSDFSAIPEPNTIALSILGFSTLLFLGRNKRSFARQS